MHPNDFSEYRIVSVTSCFCLAYSLHEKAYNHNPGLRRFIKVSGPPFHARAECKKVDLDAR